MTSAQQPSPSHQIKNEFVLSITSAVLPVGFLEKKHVLIFPLSEDKTAWVQKVEAFPGLGALCSELCGQQDVAADGCWLKPV